MKKVLTIFMCLLMTVVCCWALIGSDISIKTYNKQVFEQNIMDAPNTISKNETVCVKNASAAILESEHNCDCEQYVELLNNGNGEAEYVMSGYSDGGYVIFHRMTGEIMEINFSGISPYADCNGSKYYFGPSNYVVNNNGIYKDLQRDATYTEDALLNMKSYMLTKRNELIEKSDCKSHKQLSQNVNFAVKNISNDKSSPASPEHDVDFNTTDNPYLSDVNLSDFSTVYEPDLFAYAQNYNQYGENNYGSCQYVAATMLLRYHDYVDNDSLIPEFDNSNIPQSWRDACDGVEIFDYDADVNDPNAEKYDATIDTSMSSYEALHNYLAVLSGITQFATDSLEYETLNSYSNTLAHTRYTTHEISNNTSKVQNICNQIDSDHPVIINIYTKYSQTDGYSDGHSIVAYGYYSVNGTTYFLTHFGWGETDTQIVVPAMFLYGKAVYISDFVSTTSTSHTIDYYADDITYHFSCDDPNCFVTSNHKYFASANAYAHRCICGSIVNHTALDGATILQTSGYHYVLCEDCFNSGYISDIGNESRLYRSLHVNSYVSDGASGHHKSCSICGYNGEISSHVKLFGRCILCGYRA